MTMTRAKILVVSTALSLSAGAGLAQNLVVDGSLCVGFDCPASPSFGFDTIRLQENNLRIHFEDTSTTASFPTNDWRIIVNDSANGGSSYFGVEDSTAGRTVFRVFAGARANALTVDSQGDVGLGTTTPATDIDIKTGDTPTVRLQQDGTSGFAPQTWDVAGNEAGFFVRDATSGSTLPFRIIAGGAPSGSLVIDDDGDVGIGAGTNPEAPLEIERQDTFVFMRLTANTAPTNQSADVTFTEAGGASELRYNIVDGDNFEMSLNAAGDLVIDGTLTTGGPTCGSGCDRVFDADYDLPSIDDHAEMMFANRHLPAVGPTAPGVSFNMTEKMGNMLNELEVAHIYIDQLHDRLRQQEDLLREQEQRNSEDAARMTDLSARLQALEAK